MKDFTGSTQSTIQVVGKIFELKHIFFESLRELDDKYDIKDNVFVLGVDGQPQEAEIGYYGQVATFESMDDALENFNPCTQALRIHENQYSVGNMYRQLDDVKESVIIDIKNHTLI